MAWVYILQSDLDGRFYVGSTNDLNDRLQRHTAGRTYSTSRMGNLSLVFSQEFPSFIEARSIESRLKRLKRKDYLEKIVKEGVIKMRPA